MMIDDNVIPVLPPRALHGQPGIARAANGIAAGGARHGGGVASFNCRSPSTFPISIIFTISPHHDVALGIYMTARPGARLHSRLYDCVVLRAVVAVVPMLDQVGARHTGARAQRGRANT